MLIWLLLVLDLLKQVQIKLGLDELKANKRCAHPKNKIKLKAELQSWGFIVFKKSLNLVLRNI